MLIFFLIFSFLNLFHFINGEENSGVKKFPTTIKEKIECIDPQDLPLFEKFLRHLFQNGSFAYTLFEYKPMANHWNFLSCMNNARSHTEKEGVIIDILGWKVWEKYSHLFPSKNFIFTMEYSFDESYQINLINKNMCIQTINKHLTEFQKCFGQQSSEEILNSISIDLGKKYYDNPGYHTCLGLLFGFGEKNSKMFEERSMLLELLYQVPYDIQFLDKNQKQQYAHFLSGDQKKRNSIPIDKHKSIKLIEEELNYFKENSKPFSFLKPFYLNPIKGITFISFDENETQSLQEKYHKVYQQLVDVFNSENFLEIILTKISP